MCGLFCKFDYGNMNHEIVGEADPLVVVRALADGQEPACD